MKKPNIIRFQQCKFFPDKPFYSDEDLKRLFLNQTILITEKYDGSGVYDKDLRIFFEDLTKPSTIKYDTRYYNKKILIAYDMGEDYDFVPARDEEHYKRYGDMAKPQQLFFGEVDNLQDLKDLVRIFKKQRSSISCSPVLRSERMKNLNKMEGVVIYAYNSLSWAKSHNDWFLEILTKSESKHKNKRGKKHDRRK